MSCPHGLHSSPDRCSICLGVPARQVSQRDGFVVIDGVAVRPIVPPGESYKQPRNKR